MDQGTKQSSEESLSFSEKHGFIAVCLVFSAFLAFSFGMAYLFGLTRPDIDQIPLGPGQLTLTHQEGQAYTVAMPDAPADMPTRCEMTEERVYACGDKSKDTHAAFAYGLTSAGRSVSAGAGTFVIFKENEKLVYQCEAVYSGFSSTADFFCFKLS